jgi:hypothetical protein
VLGFRLNRRLFATVNYARRANVYQLHPKDKYRAQR